MAITTKMRVMILVKAAPVLTSQLQESMCVAAMSLDEPPRWIRLHPVPFRDLEDTTKFRKYQEVTVEVFRPRSDRRPESWTPIDGSIVPGPTLGTDHGWSARRQRVDSLSSDLTMCELVELNRSGSGPETPSLAVVRTREAPKFVIKERDAEQLAKWQSRAVAIGSQPSLFEDAGQPKAPFEVIPWRFSYHYNCLWPDCKGHKQTTSTGRWSPFIATSASSRTGASSCARSSRTNCGRPTATPCSSSETKNSTRRASSFSACSGRQAAGCRRLCSRSHVRQLRGCFRRHPEPGGRSR